MRRLELQPSPGVWRDANVLQTVKLAGESGRWGHFDPDEKRRSQVLEKACARPPRRAPRAGVESRGPGLGGVLGVRAVDESAADI